MGLSMELIDVTGCSVIVHAIDEDSDIQIENTTHDVSCYFSIEQTKQLIEFLQQQIQGK